MTHILYILWLECFTFHNIEKIQIISKLTPVKKKKPLSSHNQYDLVADNCHITGFKGDSVTYLFHSFLEKHVGVSRHFSTSFIPSIFYMHTVGKNAEYVCCLLQ